jgi:enamine deaminase RidA (YjgF/YER057c/UK114 family)
VYRIDGTTLATSPNEEMPAQHYTISGDSLWAIVSGQIALTEAVTSMKMDAGKQIPLVRRR